MKTERLVDMLKLKEANYEDAEKEWEYIRDLPEAENGFTNGNHGVSRDEFMSRVLPEFVDYSKGINLPKGYVPETQFFLWLDDEIVGLFRIRHRLNEALRNGAGHIGYGIKKEYRGKGYATEGMKMTLERARKLVEEDEIYMSVNIDNPASLKVQQKFGAVIDHSDDKEYYTRIRK